MAKRHFKKARSKICSCGCGREIEPERYAAKQSYKKECHAKYMRSYRTNKAQAANLLRQRMAELQVENKQLRNQLNATNV